MKAGVDKEFVTIRKEVGDLREDTARMVDDLK